MNPVLNWSEFTKKSQFWSSHQSNKHPEFFKSNETQLKVLIALQVWESCIDPEVENTSIIMI